MSLLYMRSVSYLVNLKVKSIDTHIWDTWQIYWDPYKLGTFLTLLSHLTSRRWLICLNLCTPMLSTDNERNFEAGISLDVIAWNYFPHYCPFVRTTLQCLLVSLHKRSTMRIFGVFFGVSLSKMLNKLSSRQWFDRPWRSWVMWCLALLSVI